MAADPDAPFGRSKRTGKPRKSPAKGGRPELLSDQIVKDLVGVLIIGSTIATACALAGITTDSFWRWSKRGAREKRKGKDTKYSRFSDSVKKAMAQAVVGFEGVIAEAARGSPELKKNGVVIRPAITPSWQAAFRWLESRYPRDYARRTFQVEEERGPQTAVGNVVPYEVALPAIDALPAPSGAPDPEEEPP